MATASYLECMALVTKCKNKKEWRACFEAVEDRQQEMTDGEYLELMGHFTAGRLYCTCVSHDDLCTSSLEDVVECRNFEWHRQRWPALGFLELAIRPRGYAYREFLDFRLQLGEHPTRFDEIPTTAMVNTMFAFYTIPHENQLLHRIRLLYIVLTISAMPKLAKPVNELLDRIADDCDGNICYSLSELIGWGDCPFQVLRKEFKANKT